MLSFNMLVKKWSLVMLIILLAQGTYSQTVGLVLSGGGAKGIAHVGVLIALEENNVPIDYIAGTSMGGMVGGLYASGYSPSDMEYIALSKDFQNWVSGNFTSDYKYFYKKKNTNASIVSLGLGIDSSFQARLRSNLVNDIPLNFALLQMTAQATLNSNANFDSLMIPYRCMIADVFSQEQIAIRSGNLSDALRATMTVPFVYRPIKVNGRYVFDGGIYNNFPVDVMHEEFNPDVVIGVNVSSKTYQEYPFETDEDLVSSRLLNFLFLSKTDSNAIGDDGIYIQPDVGNYSVVDFKSAASMIKAGYDAATAKMPEIKALITREQSEQQKRLMREKFINRKPTMRFNELKFTGINSRQKIYLDNVIRLSNTNLSLSDIKEGYYRVVADDNFRTVYPRLIRSDKDNVFDFDLEVRPERNLRAEIGGNISSRPLNTVFFGLLYNYLNVYSLTVSSDFYLGRFYEAVKLNTRIDYPWKFPFYVDADFVYNHWDYFKGSQLFLEDPILTFVDQTDRTLQFSLGLPIKGNAKLVITSGGFNVKNRYSQTNVYTEGDTLDFATFNTLKQSVAYEMNSLNEKQFATAGAAMYIRAHYFAGISKYLPGTESTLRYTRMNRDWIKVSAGIEQYSTVTKDYTLGWVLQGVFSNQPRFTSYQGTKLISPAFNPMIDSRTLLLPNYRAFNFAAAGIRNIFFLNKNLHLRLEAYVFQPYQLLKPSADQKGVLGKPLEDISLAGNTSLVYRSPIGPISLNFSIYDDDRRNYSFLFNMGYLIFNKGPFD